MRQACLLAPLLLLAGSLLLFFPAQAAPLLSMDQASLAGLALLGPGFGLAWWLAAERETGPRISSTIVQRGTARRLKIRIRCAR